MNTPAPVNIAALKGILANAKKVMNKVEEKTTPPKSSNKSVREDYDSYQQPAYDERDEREPIYEQFSPQSPSSMQPQMYTAEQVMASNLPQAIKEAMIKNPIPQLQGPPSSFSLEDLDELVEKPKPKFKSPSIPLREEKGSYQQPMSIDPNVLKAMIKEAVAEYFKESYEKRITESAIAKTINLLIKEGKIQTKKKI
jgi:hypothetical protein